MTRLYLVGVFAIAFAWSLNAQVMLVPMHDDFVIFDLTSKKIIHRLNYVENAFGVFLTIEPAEGRYLFYRPRFGLSNQVIRYDFVMRSRLVFTHQHNFASFRALDKNHAIIDGQVWEMTAQGGFIPSNEPSAPPLMWREVIAEGQTTVTAPGDSTVHHVTPSGTELKEVYWSPSLQGFFLQLAETYQENSWNNRYFWAFYDVPSKKFTRFDALSGRLSANSGGGTAPERPQAELLPRFILPAK